MNMIADVVHPGAAVMKGAHVQLGCTIGQGTRIWQFASVIRKAQIGENCRIAAGAIVDGSRIGNNCIISHCAFIDPGMVIGDNVFIGPFVAMCNDAWPRVSKNGFDIDALINGEFITTVIGDGASIGAHAVILPGRIIGAGSMVAAGAVVTADVPDNHVYHRDGKIVPIDPRRPARRMREAGA